MDGELGDLIAGIDRDFDLPAPNAAHAVRRRLQDAVSPALLLSTARRLLANLTAESDAQYLYSDPAFRYGIEIFCWPPGFGNRPHLHLSWNVSAVLAGTIDIFRSTVSAADCLLASPLVATAGEVGILIPPQFHFLKNNGTTSTITLHVFSADSANGAAPTPEPRPLLAAKFSDDDLLAIVAASISWAGPQAQDIVVAAFDLVKIDAKLSLMKMMATTDLSIAAMLARRLAALVGGVDELRLMEIARGLESRVGE